jgi:hypothetical protein
LRINFFDLPLSRPRMEMKEKKIPTSVVIEYRFKSKYTFSGLPAIGKRRGIFTITTVPPAIRPAPSPV